ncbi:hypothetical protein AgCh_030195 [Apium graveolens]
MSGVVDLWAGELAKLGEKVKIQKCVLLKTSRRSKKACESQGMEVEEEAEQVQVKAAAKKDNTFSESTVFMLMNGFAPS